MRTTRIYTPQELALTQPVTLESAAAQHVITVLRLTAGAPLTLFNGDGHDYSGNLVTATRSAVTVALTTRSDPEPLPPLTITLALGVTKGERMDYSLQKAVELGVTALVPLFTERCVVKLDAARVDKRQQHWRGVITAACEQSGRRRVPTLAAPLPLPAWLRQPPPFGLLLDPRATLTCDQLTPPPAGQIALLVGPEGGLSAVERAAAQQAGYHGVRLGPRILRTETAPLAAIAALQMLWGDWRGN